MTKPQCDALFRFAVCVLDDDDDGISGENYNLLLDLIVLLPKDELEGRFKKLRDIVNATDNRFYLKEGWGKDLLETYAGPPAPTGNDT